MGVTEESDCIAVVVSDGRVRIAEGRCAELADRGLGR
jgi:DNA integrity scanning protein DisA with diadenylate cyclase activity